VTDYALLLAEELKLPPAERFCLQIAGPLHDIGKIGLDDAILRKEDSLTPAEYEHVKEHSQKGAALLETIADLSAVVPVVRGHHERWDGRGYPDGLAGEKIPRVSRLIAVADAFDVLTSTSPYRAGGTVQEALVQVRNGAGTQFDPDCAEALLRLEPRLDEFFRPHAGTPSAEKRTFSLLMT
jgi:HD-GYP domain-containing protein (c-di-GMP phosphodiesterase class II)